MRRFPLIVATLVALACAACSKEPAKPPAEAAVTPAAAEPPAPPPPPAAEVATPAEPAVAPMLEPTPAAARPATPPPERVVRVVAGKERRIHALLNNAIARDVTGETEHDAGMWEARRAACKTQTCVDRAYAAQETELRKWEGSEAIR